ncbi:hypothetical protein UFOVP1247_93 [uncultured Caudovirales phage]|uniref:Uncharacterized protein n=1 Tax=uncultured Caudovirales phage TaxID=2100421 RepID=A0A6J5RIM4_9CAUD|nr:hypothetical protein UFOVP970_133 [uncultured Caudovirales phage]CAB4193528.1 hypothetical protein UFOVP1247_93 [uncultured Caudovirales phage]
MTDKETLEEAAEKNCESITYHLRDREKAMFIKGAKWQQERMYSEEEVEQLIHQAVNDSHCKSNKIKRPNSNECAAFVNEWFEQNKKK